MEREICEREINSRSQTAKGFCWHKEGGGSMCELDKRKCLKQHLMRNWRRGHMMPEHTIFHQEEEREILTNPGLPSL